MDNNTFEGTIKETYIRRRAVPTHTTYTIKVHINLADVTIEDTDSEENLSKRYGIQFDELQCDLPDLKGRKCLVLKDKEKYTFSHFL